MTVWISKKTWEQHLQKKITTDISQKNNAAQTDEVETVEAEIVERQLPKEIDDELDKLGDKKPEVIQSIIAVAKSYKGPLPSAEEFKHYEQTLPGAAARIMTCMEEEQKHRHQITERMSSASAQETARGQYMAFFLLLLLIVGGIICIFVEQPSLGAVFIAAPLFSAIMKFITSKKNGED